MHGIRLNVRSQAWDYLASELLDPDRDVLVFVWGTFGADSRADWSVGIFSRDDLPMTTTRRLVESKLGRFSVAIPQRQHMDKLDGRTLSVDSGELTVS